MSKPVSWYLPCLNAPSIFQKFVFQWLIPKVALWFSMPCCLGSWHLFYWANLTASHSSCGTSWQAVPIWSWYFSAQTPSQFSSTMQIAHVFASTFEDVELVDALSDFYHKQYLPPTYQRRGQQCAQDTNRSRSHSLATPSHLRHFGNPLQNPLIWPEVSSLLVNPLNILASDMDPLGVAGIVQATSNKWFGAVICEWVFDQGHYFEYDAISEECVDLLEAKIGGTTSQWHSVMHPGDDGWVQCTREWWGGPCPVYHHIPNTVFWVWVFDVLRWWPSKWPWCAQHKFKGCTAVLQHFTVVWTENFIQNVICRHTNKVY